MQNFISKALFLVFLTHLAGAQTLSKETILLETAYGNVKIKLYEETPLHKANFLKLVKQAYFDSLLFHRVINNFMIQGGDHTSKYAKAGDTLGEGDIGYTVPAEFNPKIYHKKGRLCAARDGDDVNPKRASSATQFYIVMGKKRTMEDLKKYEDRINKANATRELMKTEEGKRLKKTSDRLKAENKSDSLQLVNARIEELLKAEGLKIPQYKFNQQQIELYTSEGGTPHLDGSYTVFGEVIEGLEVIDKIATVKTDKHDRPLEDIRMKVSLVK